MSCQAVRSRQTCEGRVTDAERPTPACSGVLRFEKYYFLRPSYSSTPRWRRESAESAGSRLTTGSSMALGEVEQSTPPDGLTFQQWRLSTALSACVGIVWLFACPPSRKLPFWRLDTLDLSSHGFHLSLSIFSSAPRIFVVSLVSPSLAWRS